MSIKPVTRTGYLTSMKERTEIINNSTAFIGLYTMCKMITVQ